MKKSPNTDDVSLRSAQSAGLGRKMGGDEAKITHRLLFGTAKWLAKPCEGGIIATTTKKAQYDSLDNKSNGKSQLIILEVQPDTRQVLRLVWCFCERELTKHGNLMAKAALT